MRSFFFVMIVLTLGACVTSSGTDKLDEAMSTAQQQAMLDADIILIGEQHDNPYHHTIQRQILDLFGQKSQLASVVFEQANWEQQPILSALNNRSVGRLRDDLQWDKSGWPDFKLYEPLFVAATRYRAQVIAGNIAAAKSKAILQAGYGAVFQAEEQKNLGLQEELPPEALARLEQEIDEGHCKMLPKDRVRSMVSVQRARDAAMALAWARHHRPGKAVFIVGAGHARKDFGIPWYLKHLQPDLKIYSIGLNEVGSDTDEAAYDKLISSPVVERPDPCAGLQEKLQQPKS